MPTREQVLELVRAGCGYEEAAARLGISPGLAYLIATGIPADSTTALAPEELEREGVISDSTQHLAIPPARNPTRNERVLSWAHERAKRELATNPSQ